MRATRLAPLAALLLGATPALAQQQAPARPEGYKDPGTAQLIGLLAPGAGQIWIGGDKQKKGFVLLGVGVLAPIVGAVASTSASCDFSGDDFGCRNGTLAPLYIGLLASVGAEVYGIITADDDAKDHNRKLGARVALLERVQPVIAPGREGTAVGLSLRF